jgi:hypothetical protein
MAYCVLPEPGHGIVGGVEMIGSAVLLDCDLKSLALNGSYVSLPASAITCNKANLRGS